MRTALVLVLVSVLVSCTGDVPTAGDLRPGEIAAAKRTVAKNYVAPLSGGEEVPANDSRARGLAKFQLSADGESLSYKLIVANIENVRMAHIHLAPAGQNGGIVVWLYPDGPPPQLIPGRTNGILAEGTIAADDLTGSLAGQPLSALLDAMATGGAYVNVHTDQFPPGEIRGQIKAGG
ncbi:MAG: CHRD domain-containing protein [Gemmatimonadota bacterium]